ncbi:MAG TPA: ComF family protein [Verrucomicrobiae bacterium]|jgi:ComF family protein
MKNWLEAGVSFLYPEVCQICAAGRATRDEGFVCSACRQNVRFVKPPYCERCGLPFPGEITAAFECSNCRDVELHFTAARSAVLAADLVLDVIHRYKYKRALWFEPFLAALLTGQAGPVLRREEWDLILPVPLHRLKEEEREFNQAERLSRHLGAATGLPVQARWLRRVTPTRTQTLLSRTERAANVRHAFALRDGHSPRGQSIVIVDDVLTTGATTNACARVLRAAGASKVCVWTVARGT